MDSGEITSDTHVTLRNGETTKVRLLATRGTHEIWGTVVDTNGEPVPYAHVEAAREGEFREVSTPGPPPTLASAPPPELPPPPMPPPEAPPKEAKPHLSGPIVPAPGQKGTRSKPPSPSSFLVLQPVQPGNAASPAGGTGGKQVWMQAPVASRNGRSTQADALGAFKITRLIEGKYTIRAYRDREGSSAEGVTLHIDTGDRNAVVVLPATTTFEGQLSFPTSVTPPERFVIMLQSATLHLHRREEFFKTQGGFLFEDLVPGDYEVFVETAEWKGDIKVTLPVASMTTIDMKERRAGKKAGAHAH